MYRTVSSDISQKIRNMSLLCAILVVSIHINWQSDGLFTLGWFMKEFVRDGVAGIAVPFFFVVSGFFLAQHFDDQGWWLQETCKRINTLAIPFIIWALIYKVAINPYPWPLWYVRCLILFILTGAVFKWGVNKFGAVWLLTLFALSFLPTYMPDLHVSGRSLRSFFVFWYSLEGAFYFSVGIFVQRTAPHIKASVVAYLCGAIGLIALVAIKIHGPDWWTPVLRASLLPCLMYSIWHFMPSGKIAKWITSCSFPIFLMHMIFVTHLPRLMCSAGEDALSQLFIVFIGSICASIGATIFLRRFLPRTALVLFGGR